MNINFIKLHENANITKAKEGDSGYDLVATSKYFDEYGNVCYGTGIAVEIPNGYEGNLRPRSSIRKYSLALANSPGTIDSNYRGEIIAVFKPTLRFGTPKAPLYEYEIGDRICQLVIGKVESPMFIQVSELSDSNRGTNGFGSTGK